MPEELRPRRMLEAFGRAGCDFVVIGGIAAAVYGAGEATDDVDLLCDPSPENRDRLARALTRMGGVVAGSTRPPQPIMGNMLDGFQVITFVTQAGSVDLLFEAKGGARFADVEPGAIDVDVNGVVVKFCGRDDLVAMKRAAGRPHDLKAAAELEAGALERELMAVPEGEPEALHDPPPWLEGLMREKTENGGDEGELP